MKSIVSFPLYIRSSSTHPRLSWGARDRPLFYVNEINPVFSTLPNTQSRESERRRDRGDTFQQCRLPNLWEYGYDTYCFTFLSP